MTPFASRPRPITATVVALALLTVSAHAQQPNPRLTAPDNPKNLGGPSAVFVPVILSIEKLDPKTGSVNVHLGSFEKLPPAMTQPLSAAEVAKLPPDPCSGSKNERRLVLFFYSADKKQDLGCRDLDAQWLTEQLAQGASRSHPDNQVRWGFAVKPGSALPHCIRAVVYDRATQREYASSPVETSTGKPCGE